MTYEVNHPRALSGGRWVSNGAGREVLTACVVGGPMGEVPTACVVAGRWEVRLSKVKLSSIG